MRCSLPVPRFARLDEYAGAWLIEPFHAAELYRSLRSIDLAAHVRANLAQPKAAASPLETVAGKGGQSVALIKATGVLMKQQASVGGTSTIALRRAVRQAAADSTVSGILLAIDSPGGTVAGTADLAADVRAARKSKPVWAHIDDLGASAAYWVASQADQVWANTGTAMVGSIGTVMYVTDTSARNERDGVRELAFATGPLKSFGDGEGVSEEQAAYLQGVVNDLQAFFAAGVRRARGLNDSRMAEVSSGAVYPAERARALGLIDGIRPLDATIAALAAAK